jgi:fatty acid kinase
MPIRYIDGHRIRRALLAAAQYLEHKKEYINQLNVFPVPDGDTGSNMARTVWSGVSSIKDLREKNAGTVLGLFAEGALLGARGNSGVILSQIFQGMAERAQDIERMDAAAFAQSLERGCSAAYGALLEPQEGTILTVMKEPSTLVREMAGAGESNIGSMLAAFLKQARLTLENTPERLEVLKEAGVVDAGGYGLVTIIEGMLNIVEDATWSTEDEPVMPSHEEHIWETDPNFRFCMVFSIMGTGDADIDHLKSDLSGIGGSILCARGKNMIKVHVHSNDPEQTVALANRFGNVADLKQEDMRAQQQRFLGQESSAVADQKTGVVAVAPGDGFARILQSLGVHRVLFGGPTMNPSVAELLTAVNELPQSDIVIFPNDKNIILTADQVKTQSGKSVEVIGTTHVPQAISAMLNYDPVLGAAENAETMTRAAEHVSVGTVTTAIRDVKLSGISVKSGEIISLVDNKLFSSHANAEDGALELLEEMMGEGTDVISIYFGEDGAERAASVKETVAARYSDHSVELHRGGQAHYFYIISVE